MAIYIEQHPANDHTPTGCTATSTVVIQPSVSACHAHLRRGASHASPTLHCGSGKTTFEIVVRDLFRGPVQSKCARITLDRETRAPGLLARSWGRFGVQPCHTDSRARSTAQPWCLLEPAAPQRAAHLLNAVARVAVVRLRVRQCGVAARLGVSNRNVRNVGRAHRCCNESARKQATHYKICPAFGSYCGDGCGCSPVTTAACGSTNPFFLSRRAALRRRALQELTPPPHLRSVSKHVHTVTLGPARIH